MKLGFYLSLNTLMRGTFFLLFIKEQKAWKKLNIVEK